MFDQATRSKVRFVTNKGNVTIEDLWDMPLTSTSQNTSLDDLARSLHKRIQEAESGSFVTKKTTINEVLELKFELVKHIIGVKLNEAKLARKEAENKKEKEKILGIISEKQDEALKDMDIKDLKKMAKKL